MRSRLVLAVWVVTGMFGVLACSGKSTRDGSAPALEGDSAEPNGGEATEGTGAVSGTHDVSEYCDRVACPASPEDVAPVCMACPAAPDTPLACTENIFGGTRRYPSSCGGQSVEVHFGFDVTVWHFDAAGNLVGVTWGSDTSSAMYGRQCTRTGSDEEDLCAATDNAEAAASAREQCGVPGDVVTIDSAEAMTQHLVGQWLYCSGVEIFTVKHDGLELAANGNWYFLRFDTDGNLARQKGFDGGGKWSLIDTSAMNGPGSYQVNIDTEVGSNPSHPAFQENPEAMRLQTTGGITDYVAVRP